MSDGLKNSPLPDEDSLPAESLSTPADEPAGGGTALPFSAAAQPRTPAGSTAGATAPAAPAAGVASGTAASGAPSTGTADPAGVVRDRAGLVPLTPGTRVHGTITGIVDYGAFLVTDDGRRGLIHISEIADWYVERAEDYFYKGERVQVEVVHFDPNSGKYAFSTRRLGGKQPLANRYADRLLELHRYGAGSTRPGSGSGWNRRYRPGRTGRPATGPAGTWRSAGGTGRHPGTGAVGPSPSGPAAEASAAGRGLAGAREPGSGHPRPGLPGSRFHRPGAGPAFRFTGPGTGRMGSTGLGRTSPHPAAGEVAGDTGLPAGRAGAQPLTGPAVVREGDPDLRDSAYGVVEGGLHSGREAREALLQLLRHHVGQVSPAARSELDRLVETYGTERVATALARVLEETDRALQVVEAAGRQLAGG
ncbi:S1 RNA-binding domain-containing protein [Thermaerobacter litoralis]